MTDAAESRIPHQGAAGTTPPTLWERQQQLMASPGYRAMALLDRINRMSYVFQCNVAQYLELVAGLQNPSAVLPILDIRNPGAHDNLLCEAERLLHNVLIAMSTRVDQQRVFIKKHFADRPQVQKDYAEQVAVTFHDDPNAAFLKGLRNYIAHQQLPVGQSRQDWSPTGHFSVSFQLPVAPLVQASTSWSSAVRKWLDQRAEVPIVDVVRAYASSAERFDQWLHQRVRTEYEAEIAVHLRERAVYDREAERLFDA